MIINRTTKNCTVLFVKQLMLLLIILIFKEIGGNSVTSDVEDIRPTTSVGNDDSMQRTQLVRKYTFLILFDKN